MFAMCFSLLPEYDNLESFPHSKPPALPNDGQLHVKAYMTRFTVGSVRCPYFPVLLAPLDGVNRNHAWALVAFPSSKLFR